MAILSCHQFTSINFITGCLIRYTCLNSRLTVFVSCLRRLLVVSRLRLRTLAWRSLAIIRRLLIPSRASRQFIACEIFYEYPMVWYHLILSLLKVHFCQKVLILSSYLQIDEHFTFLNLKIWILVVFRAVLAKGHRECVTAGARTRRSLGHHLLHPLILRLLVLCAPTDFEAQSSLL